MTTNISIPRKLPLLVVSDVLLPGSSMRIPVRTLRNMNMVRSRLLGRNTLSSTIIGVVPKEPGDTAEDTPGSALHQIGVAAVVVQVTGTNWPQPAYTLLVTGLARFRVNDLIQEVPYMVAKVSQLDKLPTEEELNLSQASKELTVLSENFRSAAAKLVDMLDVSIPVVGKLRRILNGLPSQHLPDICSSIVKASYSEKLQVLDSIDLTERFRAALPLLMRQIEGLNMLSKAGKQPKFNISSRSNNTEKRVRVFDEDDSDGDDITDIEQRIRFCQMPDMAEKTALKELRRLKKMPAQMPEHAMIRNYLELMVDLPWSKVSKDRLDIQLAKQDLDHDHYGLDKVKKRIIEYLAVRQLKNSLKGPILCFVGPPGVGKTSIGRSIAHTLGREFHRIALGGVCDQSDIRGHRRTYIGSMPGRIIQGLKQVQVSNPVFLLDEIDKLSRSLHGDPAAALLEVLDPEQNSTFTDHYLNVPYDLSQVLFIATANTLESIPAALLDRMEVIGLPGYTPEEKCQIAQRHIIPKQISQHGLTPQQIQIPHESTVKIVSSYTREAGVRTMERKLAAICRAVAVKVAEQAYKHTSAPACKQTTDTRVNKESEEDQHVDDNMLSADATSLDVLDVLIPPELPIVIDEQAVEDILGPRMYDSEVSERLSVPGVAVGLAWTAMGGEIMYVEATRLPGGDGTLTLTGQLGDVMKESANLALNWMRSKSDQLGLTSNLLEDTDVHIHFPAGAVSKDGPSAGVTIATVLVSLFTQQLVRSDTAMTGEITLRGLVLPVGGVKEKVMAAHRAGITRIILPTRNKKDLHEIPSNVKEQLTFMFAFSLDDVLNAAFTEEFPPFKTLTHIDSKL